MASNVDQLSQLEAEIREHSRALQTGGHDGKMIAADRWSSIAETLARIQWDLQKETIKTGRVGSNGPPPVGAKPPPPPSPPPVTEARIDRTGTSCVSCQAGIYRERTLQDDMHGVLHCSECWHQVGRWRRGHE